MSDVVYQSIEDVYRINYSLLQLYYQCSEVITFSYVFQFSKEERYAPEVG